jgi:hypothetical protein
MELIAAKPRATSDDLTATKTIVLIFQNSTIDDFNSTSSATVRSPSEVNLATRLDVIEMRAHPTARNLVYIRSTIVDVTSSLNQNPGEDKHNKAGKQPCHAGSTRLNINNIPLC